MFWNLATVVALGVGNYLGPVHLGIPINVYSSDPKVRMEQLLIDSENLRELHDEWRRGDWLKDQPSGLTPYRIHGGVGPKSSEI
jgi:hypothetical protein